MNSDLKIFDSVEDCLVDFAQGKLLIVTDDENRENEGDLVVAGDLVSPEAINMMITHARGMICVPMSDEKLRKLEIHDMVLVNKDPKLTAFTITVDAKDDITTGISAFDRAKTVKLLSSEKSTRDDFVSPGHINPLRAKDGGVLERAGHTEAVIDLAKLCGLSSTGVICEITNDDGSMARLNDLIAFKKKHNLKMLSIASLIEYRLKSEKLINKTHSRVFQTPYGEFNLEVFKTMDSRIHYALVMGQIDEEECLARVHSENLFADMFCSSDFSNASNSFERAMKMIAKEGKGALVYVSIPSSGISLPQCQPILPTQRDYGIGAQILKELGFKKIKLLTTHLGKHFIPDGYGLEITSEMEIV